MNQPAFSQFYTELLAEAREVMLDKAADYAAADDAFANFRRRADQLGLTKEQVWAVFAMKHVDALLAYVRSGKVESEPLRQRCIDVINYAAFLAAFQEATT